MKTKLKSRYLQEFIQEITYNNRNPNIVVFNFHKCEAIISNVIEITNQYYDCNQTDKDPNKLNIQSFVEEELNNIIGSGIIE